MDLEDIMLSETSWVQNDQYVLHDFTYLWILKKSNSQKQRVKWWLLGLEGGGYGETLVRWNSFSYAG